MLWRCGISSVRRKRVSAAVVLAARAASNTPTVLTAESILAVRTVPDVPTAGVSPMVLSARIVPMGAAGTQM